MLGEAGGLPMLLQIEVIGECADLAFDRVETDELVQIAERLLQCVRLLLCLRRPGAGASGEGKSGVPPLARPPGGIRRCRATSWFPGR